QLRSLFSFTKSFDIVSHHLSLHDALPISADSCGPARCPSANRSPWRPPSGRTSVLGSPPRGRSRPGARARCNSPAPWSRGPGTRSEEHTSELQSRGHLVCRLLLEKKKLEQ